MAQSANDREFCRYNAKINSCHDLIVEEIFLAVIPYILYYSIQLVIGTDIKNGRKRKT